MRLQYLLIVAGIAALAACESSDSEGPTAMSYGPVLAGSCFFEAMQHCDEYAEPETTASTADQCASAGGTWSDGKCPFAGQALVCLTAPPATRAFAYDAAAAASLAAQCNPDRLIQLEGSCERSAVGICDEYTGLRAALGAGEAGCSMQSGAWTAGGVCATEGRSASCAGAGRATMSYAYGSAAADTLATMCMPESFIRLDGQQPMPDEDAGL